jgi:lipopolysaccharide export system protein LptA
MFTAMVATGLTVVVVLSDPFEVINRPVIADVTPGTEREGGVKLVDSKEARDIDFEMPKEFEFDVLQAYEVKPGRFEDRVAYTVFMLSGLSDPSGAFLAKGPIVTLFDLETGVMEGILRADDARFETGGTVGGSITLDFSSFHADEFSLTGNVQGDMPMADGIIAQVVAGRLDVKGELVTAPGFVKWTREDMTLTGIDMRWDGAAGQLDFASDAHLMLAKTTEAPGREFYAPGGLTWTVPPDAADPHRAGHGELRGRVTGSAGDGTRLAADVLMLDARANNLALAGACVFEREDAGGQQRLSAHHISLQRDDTGELALAEADGDVRLISTPFAMLPASMITDHLILDGNDASSPGEVTWNQEGLIARGTVMGFQGKVGRIDYQRDAELRVEEGSGHPYEGLVVIAPGGLSWTVPPEAVDPVAEGHGELRGRVAGRLPDGTLFGADMLFFDGPTRSFRLQGSSVFTQSTDASVSQLEAQRITVTGDEDGEIAVVSAEGDVIFVTGPVDVMPTRLISERLDRMGDVISSPGVVTWQREGLTVVGTGMRWNEADLRLDFDRDAQITFVDPAQRLRMELEANGGLTWMMPANALSVMADGHGELRGRVTGTTSDGAHLQTDTLLVDGPNSTFTLIGDSTITLPGSDEVPFSLSSEHLLVQNVDTSPLISSDRSVSWVRGEMTGQGTGLLWDDQAGHLHFDRDVQLDFPADGSGSAWNIAADGSFDWTVVPGSTDPFANGGGEVRGGVRGTNPSLGSFQTELLRVDSDAHSVTMLGPSRYERNFQGDEMVVSAHTSIVVRTDSQDVPLHMAAEGGANVWMATYGSAERTHLTGDRLSVDRETGVFNLQGNSRVEQPSDAEGEEPLILTATDHILARTNDLDEIVWVEAEGGVTIRSAYEGRADQLRWDLTADLAELSGNCRLFADGFWMSADRIELRPRAQSFRIIRSVLRLDD